MCRGRAAPTPAAPPRLPRIPTTPPCHRRRRVAAPATPAPAARPPFVRADGVCEDRTGRGRAHTPSVAGGCRGTGEPARRRGHTFGAAARPSLVLRAPP